MTLNGCSPFPFQSIWSSGKSVGSGEAPAQEVNELFEGAQAQHSSDIVGLHVLRDNEGRASALITVSKDGLVLAWDMEAGKGHTIAKLNSPVTQSAFSPEKLLLALIIDSRLVLYQLKRGIVDLDRFKSVSSRVTSVAFEPGGASLVVGASDGQVYRLLLDEVERRRHWTIERYTGHAGIVSAVAYHSLGRVFFSSDWKGDLSAWLAYDKDVHQGKYDKGILGNRFFQTYPDRKRAGRGEQSERIEVLRVSQNGAYLAAATQAGMLEIWKVRGLRKLTEIQAHPGLILDCAVGESEKEFVTAGRDGFVRFWSLKELRVDDEGYIESADNLIQMKLEEEGEVKLPGVTTLRYLGSGEYLAGTDKGEIKVARLSE